MNTEILGRMPYAQEFKGSEMGMNSLVLKDNNYINKVQGNSGKSVGERKDLRIRERKEQDNLRFSRPHKVLILL